MCMYVRACECALHIYCIRYVCNTYIISAAMIRDIENISERDIVFPVQTQLRIVGLRCLKRIALMLSIRHVSLFKGQKMTVARGQEPEKPRIQLSSVKMLD